MTLKSHFQIYTTQILVLECVLSAITFKNNLFIAIVVCLHIVPIFFKKYRNLNLFLLVCLILYINQTYRLYQHHIDRISYQQQLQSLNNKNVTLIGTVTEPCFNQNENKITIQEQSKKWTIKIILNEKTCPSHLEYGTVVSISGKFKSYFPVRNPGQYNKLHQAYLKKEAGSLVASRYTILDKTLSNPFKWIAYKIKPALLKQHQKSLPEPFSDLYTGLIFGIHGTSLPLLLKEKFRRVGLLHALVVSGSQVSLLIGIILFILNKTALKKAVKWTILTTICIIFYFLTGGGASIFRSILMNLITYTLILSHYKTSSFHIISFTALVMMMIDPFIIYDLGAQLSFLATMALVFGVPTIEKQLPSKWNTTLKQLLALGLAPILFTTPIIWYHFNNLAPISLLSNIILLEIIEFLVIIGFFSTLAGFIQFDIANLFHQISLTALKTMTFLVSILDSIPIGYFFTRTPNKLIIILLYCIIIITLLKQEKKTKINLILCICCLMLLLIDQISSKTQSITFLDIGQGDACVIEGKNREIILIDTGPRRYINSQQPYYDVAKTVIIPYLQKKGINKIDTLFITHYDQDHYGGLISLSESIRIKKIIDNGNGKKYPWFNELTKKHNITVESIIQNDIITINNDLKFICLNPNTLLNKKTKNNQSLVLKAMINDTSILFTGDIEATIEKKLINQYNNVLKSDILKVGHHGSKTSSTENFLNIINPTYCIISAGINNRYNHPHPAVLSNLKKNCETIYSTQKNGAIEFFIKKNNSKVNLSLK